MPAAVARQTPELSRRRGAIDEQGPFARRAWRVYLAASALLIVGYALAKLTGPAWLRSGLVFNLIGGSSVVALIVGARRNPGRRAPWYLLAVGQGLFVASDVLAYNYERLFDSAQPFPSVADPLHLAFYPFLVAGMLLLIRERGEKRDQASLIDALIVTLALATLLWVYLIAPYADDDSLSLLGRIDVGRLPLDGHPRARRRRTPGRRQPPPRAGVRRSCSRACRRAAAQRRALRVEAAGRRERHRRRPARGLGHLLRAARRRRPASLDAAALDARAAKPTRS